MGYRIYSPGSRRPLREQSSQSLPFAPKNGLSYIFAGLTSPPSASKAHRASPSRPRMGYRIYSPGSRRPLREQSSQSLPFAPKNGLSYIFAGLTSPPPRAKLTEPPLRAQEWAIVYIRRAHVAPSASKAPPASGYPAYLSRSPRINSSTMALAISSGYCKRGCFIV